MRARGMRFVATVAATALKPRIASSSPTLTGESPESGWTMTSVRGKEICRHVALGYRFVLQSMMERTAQEAERRANDESLGKTVRKQYEKLAAWIRSMTAKQLLD